MKYADEIINELKELGSPLADVSRTMPYEVPDSYFETLSDSLLAITTAPEVRLPVPAQMPYEVPPGYFSTLPQQMLFAALESDTSADLPKELPFAVPDGYFERLPVQLLNAAKSSDAPEKSKTRIISLGSMAKWAAAAMLILGVGFGSLKMFRQNTEGPATVEQAFASLPNDVIAEYVQQNEIAAAYPELIAGQSTGSNLKSLDQLPEEDIVNYLNETGWDESLIN